MGNKNQIQKANNSNSKKAQAQQLTILYEIKNEKNSRVRIFNNKFVEKNKSKCSIIINGEKRQMKEYFTVQNKDKITDVLELRLEFNKNEKIENLEFMFCECTSLLSVVNMSKLDTSNCTSFERMFYNCSSLISLPDEITEWNTSNVINMGEMFFNCSSLKSMPDLIGNWNTTNVNNMGYMFYKCEKILSLPNSISNWDTSKVLIKQFIFYIL